MLYHTVEDDKGIEELDSEMRASTDSYSLVTMILRNEKYWEVEVKCLLYHCPKIIRVQNSNK